MTNFEDILFGDSAMSSAVGVIAVKVSNNNGQQVLLIMMIFIISWLLEIYYDYNDVIYMFIIKIY